MFIKSVSGREFDSRHLHKKNKKRFGNVKTFSDLYISSLTYREIVAAVARQAHNLEVGGSNPSLATNKKIFVKILGNVKTFSDLYKVIRVEAIN